MKKSAIQKILLESVKEVIKEDNINLDEIDFGSIFKSTPPTDEQIDAYLRSRPKDKAVLDKDPERKEKWIEFVKSDKGASKAIKAKEVVFAIYDPQTKSYSAKKSTGFSANPNPVGESNDKVKLTAEEFFRNKLKALYPEKKVITLAQEKITAEQGMRWAHEFANLK
jgi:hypothetical protein